MDIGHLFCLSEVPIAGFIEKWQDLIVNIHIEDMCAGVHDHLMFGEGQIYFPPVIELPTLCGSRMTFYARSSTMRIRHASINTVGRMSELRTRDCKNLGTINV